MKGKRPIVFLVCLGLLIAFVAGCGPDDYKSSTSTTASYSTTASSSTTAATKKTTGWSKSSSGTKTPGGSGLCKYKEGGKYVCTKAATEGNYCKYHYDYLMDAYNALSGE